MSIHQFSLAGAQREHTVPCFACRASTWNVCGYCDVHCTHIVRFCEWGTSADGLALPGQVQCENEATNGALCQEHAMESDRMPD